jgi:hypothetical protein
MLVTKEDVKKALNYSSDGNDGAIDDIIERVEADFKALLCGTTFDASTVYNTETDYIDGDGTDVIILNKMPVRAITTIHLDADRTFGTDSLVPSADIITSDLAKGIVYLDGHLTPKARGSVKVVYTAGYKKTDAPADFKQIIINEVVVMFLENIGGVNTVEESDFVYRPDKLRKSALELKKKYKVIAHGL